MPIRLRNASTTSVRVLRSARVLCSVLVAALVFALLVPVSAAAKRRKSNAPVTMSSRDLKPGMKGYGLTVMRGTKVEKFGVEIIGVLYNKLPDQDMIMIRCSGLNLEHSGIIAGMSGSPIYVKTAKGDVLIGALSYGFPYNKDPVAGVTPIRDMLPELDRKRIKPPRNQRIMPPPRIRRASVDVPGYGNGTMRPVTMPLAVAGFHPEIVNAMRTDFAPFGFTPMAAAAGSTALDKPSPPLEPGSALSLSLVRGDMNISGVGTVTWVRGDKFIAFGHPFKGLGQIHLPVGGAHIVWILSSQMMSFKMGVPLRSNGVLDQDRQPAVAGRIGPRAAMVPVQVRVRRPETKVNKLWNVEIVDEPFFFPLAASLVVGNALRVTEPIAQNASVKLKVRYELEKPYKPIELNEHYVGLAGTSRMYDVRALISKLSKALVFNGFKRLRVERIVVDMELRDTRPLGFIEAIHVPVHEVDVGDEVTVRVEFMRPNSKKAFVPLTLPKIPLDLAGEKIRVWIGPESRRLREKTLPMNINDYLANVRYYVPRNRLAAVISLPDPSWMIRGERLTDLPIGVLDELSGHRRMTRTGKQTIRTTKDVAWAINGSAYVELKVRNTN